MAAEQYQQNGHPDNKILHQLQSKTHSKNECLSNPILSILSSPVLQPQSTKPTKFKTVIIFDFDDTLFPTAKFTEISNRSIIKNSFACNVTQREELELAELSYSTYAMLSKYIIKYSKRNICIVTLATPQWIKDAFSEIRHIGLYSYIYNLIFDPKDLDKDKISIYHARDNHGDVSYIEQTKLQQYKRISRRLARNINSKYKAFVDIVNKKVRKREHVRIIINTFVIIGDSRSEYIAAQELSDNIKSVNDADIFIGRIKLEKKPSIRLLIGEHDSLQELCCNGDYEAYSEMGNEFDIFDIY